jgi:hypothetical protein
LHLQAWRVLSLHIALSLSLPSIPHGQPVYFELTALVADPPRLLRTVMFCGFVGHENCPLPPERVPINSSVADT